MCAKGFSAFVSRIVLTTAFTAFFASTAFAMSQGRIIGDGVNVRSGSYLDSSVYFKLNSGQMIDVLGIEGDFYRVSGHGLDVAYIAKEFVSIVQAEGSLNDNSINIRNLPTTEGSQVIGQAYLGERLNVTGQIEDWYIIDYMGSTAYVHKDFVDGELVTQVSSNDQNIIALSSSQQQASYSGNQNDSIYGVVSSDIGLNFRAAPSTESEIIFALPYDAAVDVVEIGEEWIKSSYDGQIGYLSAEFLMIRTGQKPEKLVYAGSRADEIIEYAKRFLGTPYRWAGTNLNSGVDCSGFVYSVMKHYGINLNRTSRDMVYNGSKVSKSDLRTGDLVFFNTNGGGQSISHVGIYIGNNQFIHSSSSSRTWGVTISGLYEDYYQRNYVTACRVIY